MAIARTRRLKASRTSKKGKAQNLGKSKVTKAIARTPSKASPTLRKQASAIRGFANSETLPAVLLAADRLLAYGPDSHFDDLALEIGDHDSEELHAGLEALVEAKWAKVRYFDDEQSPIGGLARREGEYYSPARGADAAFRRAYLAWKSSPAFDPELAAELKALAERPRQTGMTAPAAKAPLTPFAAFRSAAKAGDVASLARSFQALDLRLCTARPGDFDLLNTYARELTAHYHDWPAMKAGLLEVCDGLAAVAIGVMPARGATTESPDSRPRRHFLELISQLDTFGDPGSLPYLPDPFMAGLATLACLQDDVPDAFLTLRTVLAAMRSPGRAFPLDHRRLASLDDLASRLQRAETTWTRANMGAAGLISLMVRDQAVAVPALDLVRDVLNSSDPTLVASLARASSHLSYDSLREFVGTLVKQGRHGLVDVALLVHPQALGRMARGLVREGYRPSGDAIRRIREVAQSAAVTAELRGLLEEAAAEAEARLDTAS